MSTSAVVTSVTSPPLALETTVVLTAQFLLDGVITDPTAIVCVVTDPTGTPTTYDYPTGAHLITHDSLGVFEVDVVPSIGGKWQVDWSSTGTVVVEQSTNFTVQPDLEQVTINLKNGSSAAIVGASIQVFSGPLTMAASGVTDSAGNFLASLEPGIYRAVFELSKTAFANPYSFTVLDNGDPQTFDMVGTPLTITTPSSQPTVRLFGYAVGGDGQPAQRMRVVVETVGYGNTKPFVVPPSSDTGVDPMQVIVRPSKRELITDATGYWECDVVPTALVRCYIPEVRYMKIFRVPNDPRVTTLNIRDARQDPGTANGVGIDSDTGDRGLIGGES